MANAISWGYEGEYVTSSIFKTHQISFVSLLSLSPANIQINTNLKNKKIAIEKIIMNFLKWRVFKICPQSVLISMICD